MSGFSTKGVDTTERSGVSQYLTYGVQMAALTGYNLKESKTGKKMVVLNLESPKVTDKGFEPHADAKLGGKVGRVQFTIFIDETNPEKVSEVITNIGIIADKLGVREKVDAVEANNLDDYFKKVMPIVRGKYAWWAVTGEEYAKDGGKVGITLGLRRFGFIASMEEGEAHMRPFDKKNVYDYKALAAPSKDPDVDPITEAFGAEVDENEMPWNV